MFQCKPLFGQLHYYIYYYDYYYYYRVNFELENEREGINEQKSVSRWRESQYESERGYENVG